MRPVSFIAIVVAAVLSATSLIARGDDNARVAALSYDLLFGRNIAFDTAVEELVARSNKDVVPAIVLAMRYRPDYGHRRLRDAFQALTGTPVRDWYDAALWQQAHSDITPHPSFRDLKLRVFTEIDPRFERFLGGDRSAPENMDIRLEEIVWGGVRVDGIPALDNPALIAAGDADYLKKDDLVFGIEINGDARAYPLRIMGWHEMFNDVIGGVPVSLAYCTLCGAGILYETTVDGYETPFTFGSSGFLYRSNKLMYDRQTDSLWNQYTGEAVTGPLRGSGVKLKILPVSITSWENWRAKHPDTTVLSLATGHRRDYGSGVVYADYFASDELLFPSIVGDESVVKRKDYVFGMREFGGAKAWPLAAFEAGAVINDRVGNKDVVLVGNEATRTVRAYYRSDQNFRATADLDVIADADGGLWTVEEERLLGPDGATLPRAPGHIAYWFGWNSFVGARSALYEPS